MSKKLFLLLVTMFTMVYFVNAQEAATGAVAGNGEVEEINAAAAKEAPATGKELKPRIKLSLQEDENVEVEEETGSSWWSWLWPFSSSEESAADADIPEGDTAVDGTAPNEPEVADDNASETDSMHGLKVYFPNLGKDFLDIFSVRLAAGAEAGAEFRLTRYCQFGGKYGDAYFIEHKFNRRNGGGYYDGWNFSIAALSAERRFLDPSFGDIRHYICKESKAKIVSPEDKLYSKEVRDFWAVGFDAGWLVNIRFDFHPVEFADFWASVIGMDITGDNEK